MLRWKDKILSGELDGKKLLQHSGSYFLLMLAAFAMVFFGICTPQDGSGVLATGNAAKVGGEKISANDFQRAYSQMSQRFQQQYQDGFESIRGEIPRFVMRQLVDERVMFQAALKAGVEAQEDDVIKLLKDAKAFQDESGKFSGDAFRNYLRSQLYTEASFTDEMRRNITVQNFRQFINGIAYVSSKAAALDYQISETKFDVDFVKIDPAMVKIEVSADEVTKFLDDAGKTKVKNYYDTHASEFNTKERVKARHILISYSGARNASGAGALRTKEDARKRAEDVLRQVKAPGADFAKLAGNLTDEASGKTKGGDLGLFSREDMVKEFSDAAFNLGAGQISGVVESPFGFHVIRVDDKQEAKTTTLDQATVSIAKKLIQQEKAPVALQAKADALLAELKTGRSIDGMLKDLGAKWESTGPMSPGSVSLPKVGGDASMVDAVLALSKPGDVAPKVFEAGGSKVVLKLKSRNDADPAKLDEKRQKELAQTAASSAGYTFMSSYEKALRKELEEKGKIWENQEYLKLGRGGSADQGQDIGG
jgi:peptidyl-prolyl cis-trans isomerase D